MILANPGTQRIHAQFGSLTAGHPSRDGPRGAASTENPVRPGGIPSPSARRAPPLPRRTVPGDTVPGHAESPWSVSTPRAVVPGKGFEPLKAMPADLQSAPFGRSGNLACAAYPTTNRPYCRKSPVHSSVTGAVSVAVVTPALSAYDVVCDGSRRCAAVRGSAWQCVAVRAGPCTGDVRGPCTGDVRNVGPIVVIRAQEQQTVPPF